MNEELLDTVAESSDDSNWITGTKVRAHRRLDSDDPPEDVLRRRREARRILEDRRIERELGLRD